MIDPLARPPGRPLRINWPPAVTLERLQTAVRKAREPFRSKFLLLLELRLGADLTTAAHKAKLGLRTAQRLLANFRKRGLRALRKPQRKYSKRNLMPLKHWENFVGQSGLQQGAPLTVAKARDWIEANLGVKYSLGGLRKALRRLHIELSSQEKYHR